MRCGARVNKVDASERLDRLRLQPILLVAVPQHAQRAASPREDPTGALRARYHRRCVELAARQPGNRSPFQLRHCRRGCDLVGRLRVVAELTILSTAPREHAWVLSGVLRD